MADLMLDEDINASILGEKDTSTHHEGLLLEHDEPMQQPRKRKFNGAFLAAVVGTIAILVGGGYYLSQGHTKVGEKPNPPFPNTADQIKPSPALAVPSGTPATPSVLAIPPQAANPVQNTIPQPGIPPIISQPNPVAQQVAAASPKNPLAPIVQENNSALVKRVAIMEEELASIKMQMLAISKKLDQISAQPKEIETKSAPLAKPMAQKPEPKATEARKPELAKQAQAPLVKQETKASQSPTRPQQQIMVSSPAKPVSVSQPLPLEVMPRSQSGITRLSTDGVTVQGGGFVKIGDDMADGSRLVKVDPSAGIVVTDKRILKIVQ